MNDEMTDESHPTDPDLTRLADGTLRPERAAELHARVQRSPQLAAELAEQERAVALMRALDVPAPASLRAALRPDSAARGARPAAAGPLAWLRPGVATAAAILVAVIVGLVAGGSGSSPVTIPQTARLTLAAATLPAPATEPGAPGRLAVANGGITFPNWTASGGWRATGVRNDTLGGHRVVTVFYTSPAGARLGYAIVAGTPLHQLQGTVVTRYGVPFTIGRLGSATLITWRQNGHTCVMASRWADAATLLSLATVDERPAVA